MLTYADEVLESQVYVMQAEHSVSVSVAVSVAVAVSVSVFVDVGVAWAWLVSECVCVCVYARKLVMALSGACNAARMTAKLLYYII
jgi:hypothetical protein